jgi:two-component system chemotaxis response regulator CheY
MKLLIVDDSTVIRRTVERALAGQAREIRTAGDGFEALRAFAEFEPDLVTMDLTMPNLDGLGCIRGMLEKRPQARILVITALADKPTAIEAVEIGALGYIVKPFTERRLQEEAAVILSE